MRYHKDLTECRSPRCERAHTPHEFPPKEAPRIAEGCPCHHVEPCSEQCACAYPHMSGGCDRCASLGSREQQIAAAKRIAEVLDRERYK